MTRMGERPPNPMRLHHPTETPSPTKRSLGLRLDLIEGGLFLSEPLQYSVVGLEESEVALIRKHDGAWTLLRLRVGDAALRRQDGFSSPEAALAFLLSEGRPRTDLRPAVHRENRPLRATG